MKFTVNNRWSGEVQFDAEIECDEAASASIKIGLAVKWAIKSGADLRGADLRGADLGRADLSRADLSRADLSRADLGGADLGRVKIPTIEKIDAKILAAIEAGGKLDMGTWHTCETTHCRAGWAVALAGEDGHKLEDVVGPNVAGALIYTASRPGKQVPNFYASSGKAMADIRACAAEQLAQP